MGLAKLIRRRQLPAAGIAAILAPFLLQTGRGLLRIVLPVGFRPIRSLGLLAARGARPWILA